MRWRAGGESTRAKTVLISAIEHLHLFACCTADSLFSFSTVLVSSLSDWWEMFSGYAQCAASHAEKMCCRSVRLGMGPLGQTLTLSTPPCFLIMLVFSLLMYAYPAHNPLEVHS